MRNYGYLFCAFGLQALDEVFQQLVMHPTVNLSICCTRCLAWREALSLLPQHVGDPRPVFLMRMATQSPIPPSLLVRVGNWRGLPLPSPFRLFPSLLGVRSLYDCCNWNQIRAGVQQHHRQPAPLVGDIKRQPSWHEDEMTRRYIQWNVVLFERRGSGNLVPPYTHLLYRGLRRMTMHHATV